MNIVGISSMCHDSSACLVRDGQLIAAAQEERFSRKKNTDEFPIQALNFCSQYGNILFDEVNYFGYFEKPYLKFSRVLIENIRQFPFSLSGFLRSMPKWMEDRLALPLIVREELSSESPVLFLKHHLSHAASSFLPSPFENAAILTCDGVGEWTTTSMGYGEGSQISINHELSYPNSLGLLYTCLTVFLGFHANGGEGKTMGMAGLGEPRFLKEFEDVVKIFPDGSFLLNQKYFAFRNTNKMWSSYFEEIFGKPRQTFEPIEQHHFDLAATLQVIVEKIFILCSRTLKKQTKSKNICLAGGVALNCVANVKILEEGDFENIFIQPAAGDAGGAVGAALYISNSILNLPRHAQTHCYLGPEYSNSEILRVIKSFGIENFVEQSDDEQALFVAEKIFKNKIVGWFQGRLEYGPRALGNRSILANPCRAQSKADINNKIKKRESFRPYAPLVLKEKCAEYFDLIVESPYMLLAPKVLENKRALLPAITHYDGTARVQTVGLGENIKIRKLLKAFERYSGVPILLNTSFNRNGEPVVCRPEEAINCFLKTDMDILVIGNYILEKTEIN